jgi:hypothetical protein
MQQRRLFEQELPRARYWRRAAIVLCEYLLDTLKDQLTRSSEIQTSDLCDITEMRARLQHLEGAELVAEYRWWLQHQAALVIGMVGAAENLEGAERRAVQNYIRMTEAET